MSDRYALFDDEDERAAIRGESNGSPEHRDPAEKMLNGAGGHAKSETRAVRPAEKTRPLIELITGAALFEALPPTNWLCEGLELAPGAPSLWAGYGYTGKTFAAHSLAVAVASGRDVWGSVPCCVPGDRREQ